MAALLLHLNDSMRGRLRELGGVRDLQWNYRWRAP